LNYEEFVKSKAEAEDFLGGEIDDLEFLLFRDLLISCISIIFILVIESTVF
jgi:hypothetical protein